MNRRLWFSGILEAQTALHIGTGTVLSTATNAPILRGADGRPLIPGSSVKGALRSTSERLLRALGHRACLVFGETPPERPELECLTTDERGRELFASLKNGDPLNNEAAQEALARFTPPREWGDDPWKGFGNWEARQLQILSRKLCRACLTWGSPFAAGRVRVPDLRLASGAGETVWAGATEVRDGVGLDRDTGTAARNIKFDLEVLPAGARFRFELVTEPEAELGVVALAVGELLRGGIPLGGRVTRGLGEVLLQDFAIHEVNLSNPEQLFAYLARGTRQTFEGEAARSRLESMFTGLLEATHAA